MARTRVILFLSAILIAFSGCGGIYVSSGPYYTDCYYEFIQDPWGGYEQQYCYNSSYNGFIPAVNNGYWVIRYPLFYQGPRQRVVAGRSVRVVVTPSGYSGGRTVVRTPRGRGTVYTPGVSPGGRRQQVAPTPPARYRGQPTHTPGGGRGPTARPQRGGSGGGGRGASPGRVRPRKAVLEIPAGQLRTVELRGQSFDGATLARYIDPSVPSGKILVEAVIYGESDRAIDKYIARLRRMKGIELDFAQGVAIVGRERDLCQMQHSQDQDAVVSGVCIDDITILTSREADAPIIANEQI